MKVKYIALYSPRSRGPHCTRSNSTGAHSMNTNGQNHWQLETRVQLAPLLLVKYHLLKWINLTTWAIVNSGTLAWLQHRKHVSTKSSSPFVRKTRVANWHLNKQEIKLTLIAMSATIEPLKVLLRPLVVTFGERLLSATKLAVSLSPSVCHGLLYIIQLASGHRATGLTIRPSMGGKGSMDEWVTN